MDLRLDYFSRRVLHRQLWYHHYCYYYANFISDHSRRQERLTEYKQGKSSNGNFIHWKLSLCKLKISLAVFFLVIMFAHLFYTARNERWNVIHERMQCMQSPNEGWCNKARAFAMNFERQAVRGFRMNRTHTPLLLFSFEETCWFSYQICLITKSWTKL